MSLLTFSQCDACRCDYDWILTVAAVILACAGCQRHEPIAPERVVEVGTGTIVRGVIAVGRVEPRTRVELKSKAGGILKRLLVDVNDAVHVGDVVAELDQEILAARVREAEGKLAQARAQVALAKARLDKIAVEKSDPEFEFARRNVGRVTSLHESAIASEEELDLAHERHEKARYRFRLLDAELKSSTAAVESAEGHVKEMEALADLARQELKEAVIVSPIDGVVLYRYLEEGDSVSSIRVAGGNATVMMTLGDLSELFVDGEVDEVDVGELIDHQRIRSGLPARITVESFKKRKFSGRVARITPLGLEDQNGIVTFEIRIVFDNPERLLLANMTANSVIVLDEKTDTLVVSQGALITEAGARFVLIYDAESGQARRERVDTGITDGTRVEILSGLKPGQKIVIP